MSWIRDKLSGIKHLLADGEPLPDRPSINVIGATLVDDAVNNRTNMTFSTLADVEDATPIATPETLVKRGASGEAHFAGTCVFAAVTCDNITATATITCTTIVAATHRSGGNGAWGSQSQTQAAVASGNAQFASGNSTGAGGTSGTADLASGNANGASGNVGVKSGNSTTSLSGSVSVASGSSAGGASAGLVAVLGGEATGTGRGGSVHVAGGGSVSGSAVGGDTALIPGLGAGGRGNAYLCVAPVSATINGAKNTVFIGDATALWTSGVGGGVGLASDAGKFKAKGSAATTVTLCGASGEIEAKWFQTDSGTGGKSTVGDLRGSKDSVACAFLKSSGIGNVEGIACDGSDGIQVGTFGATAVRIGNSVDCELLQSTVGATGSFSWFKGENELALLDAGGSGPTLNFPGDAGATATITANTALTFNSGGSTRFRYNATGIGFFTATPVAQQSRPAITSAYSGIDNTNPGTAYATNDNLEQLRSRFEDAITKLMNYGIFV